MKYDESLRTPEVRLKEAEQIGAQLRTLRIARGITQSDAAARAGVSRSTAVLLEQGDESRTLSQVLRYLHALEPELTLAGLLTGTLADRPMAKSVRKTRADFILLLQNVSAD